MPDIALIAPLDVESHEVVRGVFDFAASTPDWNVHWFPGCGNATVQQIEQWKPTGVISVCAIDQREVVRSMVALGTPLVNIGHLSGVCSFSINPSSVTGLIASHFQAAAFQKIAYVCRPTESVYDEPLQQAFGDQLERIPLDVPHGDLISSRPTVPLELRRWLGRFRPAAVVAQDATLATYVGRLLKVLSIKVPDELSLMSIGDSPACALPANSISAIRLPMHEMGYQAARRLHRVLKGHPAIADSNSIDAFALICRTSSRDAGQDSAMARAIHFIQENAARGITVADVMAFQQTSRVTFERHFLATVGCSPGEYIRQIKLEKAKELLVSSNQPIDAVGKACGFESPAKFSSFFKRAAGVSPAAFRRQKQDAPGNQSTDIA